MNSSIRIVVADDHPAFSDGLRRLLEIESDLKVIGQANNAADVIQRVRELKPDILLLDLRMPLQPKAEISPRGGLDALASVDRGSITKTILFAAEMETPEIVEAIELGVRGVILKSAATESLIKSIRSVISGSCWEIAKPVPSLHVLLKTKREELNNRKYGLTPKELEVVSAIVRHSMSNKDIAHHFNIAENTVKKHTTSIFNKTGVSNRLELDHFAREHKLPIKDVF